MYIDTHLAAGCNHIQHAYHDGIQSGSAAAPEGATGSTAAAGEALLLLTEGRVGTLALYSADLPGIVVNARLVPSLALFPMHHDGAANTDKGDLLEGSHVEVVQGG